MSKLPCGERNKTIPQMCQSIRTLRSTLSSPVSVLACTIPDHSYPLLQTSVWAIFLAYHSNHVMPTPNIPLLTICISLHKIQALCTCLMAHHSRPILDRNHRITKIGRDAQRSSCPTLMQTTFSVTSVILSMYIFFSYKYLFAVNMHEDLVHWADSLLPLKPKNQFCSTSYKILANSLRSKWC